MQRKWLALGIIAFAGLCVAIPVEYLITPQYVERVLTPDDDDDEEVQFLRADSGKTMATMLEERGPPAYEHEFALSEFRGPFSDLVCGYYPQSHWANRHVRVMRLAWRDAESVTWVWFHQKGGGWVVLVGLRMNRRKDGQVFMF